MAAPTTVRSGTDIIVSFVAPTANGATIIAYELVVQDVASGLYTEDATICNGAAEPAFSALSCTWAISYLVSTYSYAVGDLVLFKVRALNGDGWGALSNPTSGGATIMTVPATMGLPIEGATTSHAQIAISWSALTTTAEIGGTPITSYSLEWDQGGAGFVPLIGDPTPDTSLSYVVSSGLTQGASYVFRLRALNVIGWGSRGPTLTVIPSSVPDTMATVTTSHSSQVYAKIAWVAPDDRGAAITAYHVFVKKSDGTMTTDLTYCNGADATVIANLFCEIPMAALRAAPYSLAVGALVEAQVQAENLKGTGGLSTLNTAGAVVESEPTAPGAATRVELTTDETQITVTWAALTTSIETGGPTAPVTSYDL
jgi:titin